MVFGYEIERVSKGEGILMNECYVIHLHVCVCVLYSVCICVCVGGGGGTL